MAKRLVLVLLLTAFLLAVPLGQRRAQAGGNALTTGLIVGGAIAGATTLVLLIAVAVASADPDFMEVAPASDPLRVPPGDGVRAAPQCPRTADGNLPVLCW